jgi:hypothetical protein
MVEEVKKAIEAIQALNLVDGDEICLSLIRKVIDKNVTFLDWEQKAIIDRLPPIGRWEMIYRKNQGDGYLDFERWKIVDRKTFHDFTMKYRDECKRLNLLWPRKRLVVIAIERDSFHHSAETRIKIALARLRFVEEWLAKN